MTSVAERLITAEEFARLPKPREGGKMELVRGRVVCMPPVGPEHGNRAARLVVPLGGFVHSQRLGEVRVETGYWLGDDPDHVRAPDISFVPTAQTVLERLRDGFADRPPSLAIEVTSPNDTDHEVQETVDDYLSAGVERVWVVRPARKTVTLHRPGADPHILRIGDTLTSEDAGFEVEGFSLPLAELFG